MKLEDKQSTNKLEAQQINTHRSMGKTDKSKYITKILDKRRTSTSNKSIYRVLWTDGTTSWEKVNNLVSVYDQLVSFEINRARKKEEQWVQPRQIEQPKKVYKMAQKKKKITKGYQFGNQKRQKLKQNNKRQKQQLNNLQKQNKNQLIRNNTHQQIVLRKKKKLEQQLEALNKIYFSQQKNDFQGKSMEGVLEISESSEIIEDRNLEKITSNNSKQKHKKSNNEQKKYNPTFYQNIQYSYEKSIHDDIQQRIEHDLIIQKCIPYTKNYKGGQFKIGDQQFNQIFKNKQPSVQSNQYLLNNNGATKQLNSRILQSNGNIRHEESLEVIKTVGVNTSIYKQSEILWADKEQNRLVEKKQYQQFFDDQFQKKQSAQIESQKIQQSMDIEECDQQYFNKLKQFTDIINVEKKMRNIENQDSSINNLMQKNMSLNQQRNIKIKKNVIIRDQSSQEQNNQQIRYLSPSDSFKSMNSNQIIQNNYNLTNSQEKNKNLLSRIQDEVNNDKQSVTHNTHNNKDIINQTRIDKIDHQLIISKNNSELSKFMDIIEVSGSEDKSTLKNHPIQIKHKINQKNKQYMSNQYYDENSINTHNYEPIKRILEIGQVLNYYLVFVECERPQIDQKTGKCKKYRWISRDVIKSRQPKALLEYYEKIYHNVFSNTNQRKDIFDDVVNMIKPIDVNISFQHA